MLAAKLERMRGEIAKLWLSATRAV